MKILDYDDVKRLKEDAEKSEDFYIPVSGFMLLKFFQEIERLEKEADWLAKKIIECASGECFEECVVPCESKNAEMVRESARKAVKDETNA